MIGYKQIIENSANVADAFLLVSECFIDVAQDQECYNQLAQPEQVLPVTFFFESREFLILHHDTIAAERRYRKSDHWS